jgi:arsenate reductase-like glutaredoxin family protein
MQKDLLKTIEPILDELLKKNPSQEHLKKMMKKAGLEYSKDQYEQLKMLLNTLGSDRELSFDEPVKKLEK